MVQCKRCGIELRQDNEGEYCYPCQVDIETLVRQGELYLKKCRWCGGSFTTKIPNKLYCSDKHTKEARKENVRKARNKHYTNNKKRSILSQIGTTTLSKHPNSDFDREKEIIKNELKRTCITTVYKGKSNYSKGKIRFTSLLPKSDEIQLGTQKTHNYATFDDYVQTSISYWMNSEGSCPECDSGNHLKDVSRCEIACECGLLISGAPHPNFVYPDDNYDDIPFVRYSHEIKNLRFKKGLSK